MWYEINLHVENLGGKYVNKNIFSMLLPTKVKVVSD
jgi:hypothetical protein